MSFLYRGPFLPVKEKKSDGNFSVEIMIIFTFCLVL